MPDTGKHSYGIATNESSENYLEFLLLKLGIIS